MLAASWIPSLIVLFVFLFLPEIWGGLSHVSEPRAGRLPGYRVAIPITWIILAYEDQPSEGRAWVTGLAGRGIGLGISSYLHLDFPLSEWRVGTWQHKQAAGSETLPHIPKDTHVIEKRVLKAGSVSMTCVEYLPHYPGWGIETSSIVFIECSGSSPVDASFVGKEIHVPAVYGMLGGITAVD